MEIFALQIKHDTVRLNPYSILTPFESLKEHVFENIMENGAFAH